MIWFANGLGIRAHAITRKLPEGGRLRSRVKTVEAADRATSNALLRQCGANQTRNEQMRILTGVLGSSGGERSGA